MHALWGCDEDGEDEKGAHGIESRCGDRIAFEEVRRIYLEAIAGKAVDEELSRAR
jgi:hypothetical protein